MGQWIDRGYHADMDWLLRTRELRQDVKAKVPGARSVVVVARNYYYPRPAAPENAGRVAAYAWGRDYHRVLRKPLHALEDFIANIEDGARSYASIDSGPVLERTWAERAGVAAIGKNSLGLRRDLGSWFCLATIITTVELAPDEPTYRAAYGKHLAQRGLFREAAEHLRLALASNPVNPDGWLFLIISLTETGQYADAWQACEHVLRVGNGTPPQLERIARLLAACPDDSIRDGARAQRLVDRVRQMVPDEKAPPDFLDTYAAVAAENGDFAAALAFARRALELVQRQNVSNLVTEYERRIEQYQASQPFRLRPR
ncbi:MAG: DUF1730 domain-containing protein [Planctomycetes bacterium]|nr:DUF1730 domain-containing protein [Planctomycetota bacterium]